MPKAMQIQDDRGRPLAPFNFGEVPTGQLSAPKAIRVANTGDAPLTGVRAWLEQSSISDGELRVSIAGIGITGTSAANATPLPDLPVGAAHEGFAQYTSPTIPADRADLRVVSD